MDAVIRGVEEEIDEEKDEEVEEEEQWATAMLDDDNGEKGELEIARR